MFYICLFRPYCLHCLQIIVSEFKTLAAINLFAMSLKGGGGEGMGMNFLFHNICLNARNKITKLEVA
jgi:hypothetical protein